MKHHPLRAIVREKRCIKGGKRIQQTNAFYQIADPRVYQLCDLVCGQMAEHFATRRRCWEALRHARSAESAARILTLQVFCVRQRTEARGDDGYPERMLAVSEGQAK